MNKITFPLLGVVVTVYQRVEQVSQPDELSATKKPIESVDGRHDGGHSVVCHCGQDRFSDEPQPN